MSINILDVFLSQIFPLQLFSSSSQKCFSNVKNFISNEPRSSGVSRCFDNLRHVKRKNKKNVRETFISILIHQMFEGIRLRFWFLFRLRSWHFLLLRDACNFFRVAFEARTSYTFVFKFRDREHPSKPKNNIDFSFSRDAAISHQNQNKNFSSLFIQIFF